MKNLLIFLLTNLFISCEQKKPDKTEHIIEKSKNEAEEVKVIQPNYDFLKWNNVKINGEIPLFTNHTEVKEKLGSFDSVSAKMDDCGMYFWHRAYKKLYVKGIEFEATTDSLVFRNIDFRNSNVFLSTPKFKLDKNTTTENLKAYFPNSFTDVREKEIYGVGMLKLIQLNMDDKYTDDMWLLFFDDKKLIRVEYWIGC